MTDFEPISGGRYRFTVDFRFLDTHLRDEWAHPGDLFQPRRSPSDSLQGEEQAAAYWAYRSTLQCTELYAPRLRDPVQHVVAGPARRLRRACIRSPSLEDLMSLLRQEIERIQGTSVELGGYIPPHDRDHGGWADDDGLELILNLGPLSYLQHLLKLRNHVLESKEAMCGASVPHHATFPIPEAHVEPPVEDDTRSIAEARTIMLLKTHVPDSLLDDILLNNAGSATGHGSNGPLDKTRRAQRLIAADLAVYALEAGAAAAIIMTGTSAYLWLRRDVAGPEEAFARDPQREGLTWDVATIVGRHLKEPHATAPDSRLERWPGSLASFLNAALLFGDARKKFAPVPPGPTPPGAARYGRHTVMSGPITSPATTGIPHPACPRNQPDPVPFGPAISLPFCALHAMGQDEEFFLQGIALRALHSSPSNELGNLCDVRLALIAGYRTRLESETMKVLREGHLDEEALLERLVDLDCVPKVTTSRFWHGVGIPLDQLLRRQKQGQPIYVNHEASLEALRRCQLQDATLPMSVDYRERVTFRPKTTHDDGTVEWGTVFVGLMDIRPYGLRTEELQQHREWFGEWLQECIAELDCCFDQWLQSEIAALEPSQG